MPEDDQSPGGENDSSQSNISGAGTDGRGPGRETGRETDEGPGAERRSFQTRPGDVEPVQEPGEGAVGFGRYQPSAEESNQILTQGGGMGARDLDQQGDPAAGADATEDKMSQAPDPDNARS